MLSPTTQRMQELFDPQTFWVSDAKGESMCGCWYYLPTFHQDESEILVRMSSPFQQTYAKGTGIDV